MRESMCENPIHRANQAIYNRRIPSQAEREAFDCVAGIPGMQANTGDNKKVIASLNHGFMRLPNFKRVALLRMRFGRRDPSAPFALARRLYHAAAVRVTGATCTSHTAHRLSHDSTPA